MPARPLTLKQRRFVKEYLTTANGTTAALRGYRTDDARTAHGIASENLRKPAIREAVARLLADEGITLAKLHTIYAHFLAGYDSPEPRDRALALRALHMAYKLTGAYDQPETTPDRLFTDWTEEELDRFARTREWPVRPRPA